MAHYLLGALPHWIWSDYLLLANTQTNIGIKVVGTIVVVWAAVVGAIVIGCGLAAAASHLRFWGLCDQVYNSP